MKEGVQEFGTDLLDQEYYDDMKTKQADIINKANIYNGTKMNASKSSLVSNKIMENQMREARFRSASIDFDSFNANNILTNQNNSDRHLNKDMVHQIPRNSSKEAADETNRSDSVKHNNSDNVLPTSKQSDKMDLENLDKTNDDTKILDEKHILKNPEERVSSFIFELSNIDHNSLFDSCRELIELDNFCDKEIIDEFFTSYIVQQWNQSDNNEREKIWMMLNNFLQYPSSSPIDIASI